MQVAVINLNGTDAEELISAHVGAMVAIDKAIRAMSAAAPNGRDFQTASVGAYARAESEHVARIQALNAVRDEMCELAEALSLQKQERDARRAGR